MHGHDKYRALAETDPILLSLRELFNLSGPVEIILVLPVTSVLRVK